VGSAEYRVLEASIIARDEATRAAENQRQKLEALREVTKETTQFEREAATLRELTATVGAEGSEILIQRKERELELLEREVDLNTEAAQANLRAGEERDRAQAVFEVARDNLDLERDIAKARAERAAVTTQANSAELAQQQEIIELKRQGLSEDDAVFQRRVELVGQYAIEQEQLEKTKELFDRVEDAARDFGESAAESMAKAITEGESLSDVLDSLLKQLLELAIRMSITEPTGQLFASLAGAIAGGIAGSTTGGTTTRASGTARPNNPSGGLRFASGGAVTRQGTVYRYAKGDVFESGTELEEHRNTVVTKPTMFRFARGGAGLMGEAGAEAILPLKRTSSGNLGVEATVAGGGGGAVEFHLHDERRGGAPIESRTEQGPDMRTIIRAWVRDEVGVGMRGGSFDPALRERYNLQPRTGRR
jgi:phage-related minor tail protein